MFRSAGSALLRRQVQVAPVRLIAPRLAGRTLFSSAKPAPRRFRSTLLRWGVAAAGTYYYFTRSVFAEETEYYRKGRPTEIREVEEEDESQPRTQKDLDEIRKRAHATDAPRRTSTEVVFPDSPADRETAIHQAGIEAGNEDKSLGEAALTEPISPEELEQEVGQQGAYNEETGEINWDCPCLGGMANGPCGAEFRDAFSCFIYSKEEPKGVDCIENFKVMQECFRRFPEIYGSELEDEDAEGEKAQSESSELETPSENSTEPTIPEHPESSSEPPAQVTAEEVKEKVREEVPKEIR
ncbi:coiled-coil-helix-coiled-coil-helix domain-containing protein 4 [Peziza echinospora]|nr:coiled-coil-helix-coiled-coil-helix domain-containing protein 4 [Peziza echinospora]